MNHKFNAYRDGKVHVQARCCKTCIYRPDSPLNADGTKDRLAREAIAVDTAIICHSTLDAKAHAVCRGFYEETPTMPLRLAAAMNCLEFV